jgi:hypothetical protein
MKKKETEKTGVNVKVGLYDEGAFGRGEEGETGSCDMNTIKVHYMHI